MWHWRGTSALVVVALVCAVAAQTFTPPDTYCNNGGSAPGGLMLLGSNGRAGSARGLSPPQPSDDPSSVWGYQAYDPNTLVAYNLLISFWIQPLGPRTQGVGNNVLVFTESGSVNRIHSLGFRGDGFFFDYTDGFLDVLSNVDWWAQDLGRWGFYNVYIQSAGTNRVVTLYRNGVLLTQGVRPDSNSIQRWVYTAQQLSIGPLPAGGRVGEIMVIVADATRMNGGAFPPQGVGYYDGTQILSTMILPMYQNGFSGMVSALSVVQFDAAQQLRAQAVWWQMDIPFSSAGSAALHIAHNNARSLFPSSPYGFARELSVIPNGSNMADNAFYAPCHCATEPTFCSSPGTAQCTDGPISPVCQCAFGYTGTVCQTNINECASNPCRNGGMCTDRANGFTCACTAGWSGAACQTNINECASAPCRNGATCIDGTNSFSCVCASGFTGTLCQTEINECASQPCVGGTTCIDLVNGYFCTTGGKTYCRDSIFFSSMNQTAAVSTTLNSPNDIRPYKPFTMTMWYAANNQGETAPFRNSLYPSHFALTDITAAAAITPPPGSLDPTQRPPNRGVSIGIGFSPLGFTVWYKNLSCISSSSGAPLAGWHHYTGMARLVTSTTIELVLFIDGVRVPSTSGTCVLPYDDALANATKTEQLRVEVGSFANGAMSNMRMYQRSFADIDINVDFYSWQRAADVMSTPMIWFNQGVRDYGLKTIDVSEGYFKQNNVAIVISTPEAGSRVSFRPCRCTTATNPCSANATCVDVPSIASYGSVLNVTSPCVCPYGYSGLRCTHVVMGCESNPCMNGATCINGALPYNYTCQCPAVFQSASGFYGQNCQFFTSKSRPLSMPNRVIASAFSVGGSLVVPWAYNMSRYCSQLWPDGTRHFDPAAGFCRQLPPGYPPLSLEMFLYISMQQYGIANQLSLAAMPRFIQFSYLRIETTLLTLDRLPGGSSYAYSWYFGVFPVNNIAYFDLLCAGQPGYLFDFKDWQCARPEVELYCGLDARGTSSNFSVLQNFVTGALSVTNTVASPQCMCGGTPQNRQHCRYKVGLDACNDPSQLGLPGKSSVCDVFTQEAFFDCPTKTVNGSCVETCRCLPGTGDMPGSTRRCSGQDMSCSAQDSLYFCGNPSIACIKRCEFAFYNGYVRPTTYCAFTPGSCSFTSNQQYETCDPTGTASSASYQMQTYRYNASIPTQAGQTIVTTLTSGMCLCNADRTGLWCAQSSCPGGCAGNGVCANGLCTCSGGTFSARFGGCGCQLDRYQGCMSNGNACLSDPSPAGCQSCSGSGLCVTRPTDFSYEAICETQVTACNVTRQENPLPLLNCTCDASHTGSYCQTSRCPVASGNGLPCGGVAQGTCIVPVDGSTPYCTCRSSASTGQSLWAGISCSDDVGAVCGAVGPGGNSILCNGQGTCDKNATTGVYGCTCLNGYTGAQCQNTPCNPACPLHSTCVVAGASATCTCDNGWTDAGCVRNLCGPRALPVPTGPATNNFVCQCTNTTLDVTRCTTVYSNNINNCCVGPACPIASNGVPCGDNPQANLYGIIPVATCLNGACQCPTAYRRDTASGTCMTYCDLTHAISSSRPCNYNAGGACVSCTCTTGYDPATFCYGTVCKNGGTLSMVGSSAVCTCVPEWTGSTCTVSVCNAVGSLNMTTGICDCPFPYSGPNCRQHICLNGGSPTATAVPGVYACSCPSRWNGTVCQNNMCAPYGFPLPTTNATCACDTLHAGAFCQTSRCVFGTIQNNVCVCNTDQYIGTFCNTPRCGVTGTYDSQTGMCACSDTGVYAYDAISNNCTVSLCGAYGVPRADGSRCNCSVGAVLVPELGPAHPYYCEPSCLNGGTFVPVSGNCTCPSGTQQPFCLFPGQSLSSSSTGLGTGGGDGGATGETSDGTRYRVTLVDAGALAWTLLLLVLSAVCARVV